MKHFAVDVSKQLVIYHSWLIVTYNILRSELKIVKYNLGPHSPKLLNLIFFA